jgi:hypothetical protein
LKGVDLVKYADRMARADRLAKNPAVGAFVDGIARLENGTRRFLGFKEIRPTWCDECFTPVGDGECDVCRIQRGEPLDDDFDDERGRR